MTPKGKAKELFKKYSKGKDKYGWSLCEWNSGAKDCALIAVDEIINYLLDSDWALVNNKANYWIEVKQEIEKL